ncbi:MAG: hypothetical protein QOD95_2804 [Gammaproteobacteria bacterium]|nr:hypothetical protein [Gammaproteobacteria bacterium]
MTESALNALLDAHDALVKQCVDSALPFAEFLALYNDFPHLYALDGHEATPDGRAILQRSRKRIAFHYKVARVLSGLCSETDSENGIYGDAGRFGPMVGLMRLRELVGRHSDCKAEPENIRWRVLPQQVWGWIGDLAGTLAYPVRLHETPSAVAGSSSWRKAG